MSNGVLIGLGSGLVSALLLYSATRGGAVLGQILLFLIPLPSMVAGLGWGWLPAAASAVAGAIVVAFLVNGPFAVGYLLTLGVPVALAAYLAYLSRPHPQDPNEREWYPVGRLMAAMAIYAGAFPVLLLPLAGGSFESMRPLMIEMLRRFSERLAGSGTQLTDQALADQADLALFMLPAGMAVQWLSVCALNLYLAGRIVLASGRLGRDWPDIAALTYPPGLSLLLVLALLAAGGGSAIGIAGTSFSGALLSAYLLAGLALAHFVARRGAPWLVWLLYPGLIFLWPVFMPLVALAGLVDSTFKLKQRLGAPPPPT
jgi:hypothetical protein